MFRTEGSGRALQGSVEPKKSSTKPMFDDTFPNTDLQNSAHKSTTPAPNPFPQLSSAEPHTSLPSTSSKLTHLPESDLAMDQNENSDIRAPYPKASGLIGPDNFPLPRQSIRRKPVPDTCVFETPVLTNTERSHIHSPLVQDASFCASSDTGSGSYPDPAPYPSSSPPPLAIHDGSDADSDTGSGSYPDPAPDRSSSPPPLAICADSDAGSGSYPDPAPDPSSSPPPLAIRHKVEFGDTDIVRLQGSQYGSEHDTDPNPPSPPPLTPWYEGKYGWFPSGRWELDREPEDQESNSPSPPPLTPWYECRRDGSFQEDHMCDADELMDKAVARLLRELRDDEYNATSVYLPTSSSASRWSSCPSFLQDSDLHEVGTSPHLHEKQCCNENKRIVESRDSLQVVREKGKGLDTHAASLSPNSDCPSPPCRQSSPSETVESGSQLREPNNIKGEGHMTSQDETDNSPYVPHLRGGGDQKVSLFWWWMVGGNYRLERPTKAAVKRMAAARNRKERLLKGKKAKGKAEKAPKEATEAAAGDSGQPGNGADSGPPGDAAGAAEPGSDAADGPPGNATRIVIETSQRADKTARKRRKYRPLFGGLSAPLEAHMQKRLVSHLNVDRERNVVKKPKGGAKGKEREKLEILDLVEKKDENRRSILDEDVVVVIVEEGKDLKGSRFDDDMIVVIVEEGEDDQKKAKKAEQSSSRGISRGSKSAMSRPAMKPNYRETSSEDTDSISSASGPRDTREHVHRSSSSSSSSSSGSDSGSESGSSSGSSKRSILKRPLSHSRRHSFDNDLAYGSHVSLAPQRRLARHVLVETRARTSPGSSKPDLGESLSDSEIRRRKHVTFAPRNEVRR